MSLIYLFGCIVYGDCNPAKVGISIYPANPLRDWKHCMIAISNLISQKRKNVFISDYIKYSSFGFCSRYYEQNNIVWCRYFLWFQNCNYIKKHQQIYFQNRQLFSTLLRFPRPQRWAFNLEHTVFVFKFRQFSWIRNSEFIPIISMAFLLFVSKFPWVLNLEKHFDSKLVIVSLLLLHLLVIPRY